MAEEYGGLVGAYRYAFRRSDSWLFRSYVAASALVGAYAALLLLLGLVAWIARPMGAIGERAFLPVIGILVLLPLFAPVLIVAWRHRHDRGRTGADRLLGLAGYAFVAAVLLALLITDPREHAVAGPIAGVVAALDGLPATYGLLPPVVAVAIIVAVERLTRRGSDETDK